MIKPNELRIGNKLNYTGLGNSYYPTGIITVEEVLSNGVNLSHGDLTVYEAEKLHPIPLTPQILEKCGFKDVHGEYVTLEGIGIYNDGDDYWFCDEDAHEGNVIYYGNGFQYVHQLQNLFFALTGEELEIKP